MLTHSRLFRENCLIQDQKIFVLIPMICLIKHLIYRFRVAF